MRYAHYIIIGCVLLVFLLKLLSPSHVAAVSTVGAGLALARKKKYEAQVKRDQTKKQSAQRAVDLRKLAEGVEKKKREREKWLDR